MLACSNKDFSSGSDLFKETMPISQVHLHHGLSIVKICIQVVTTLNLDESSFVVELASNDVIFTQLF